MRTHLMTATLVALGLAGAFSSALPVRAAQGNDYPIYQNGTGFSKDVTVSSVDVDRDRVIVTGDDNRSYTLDTYKAAIALRGSSRAGETGDLVPGMRLHVTGSQLSRDIVEADQVTVLPYRGTRPTVPMPGRPADDPYGDSRPTRSTDPFDTSGRSFEMRGTVESVNNRRGSFVVRVNTHTRTVYLNDATDLSDIDQGRYRDDSSDNSDNRQDRVPLNVGDRVTVTGTLQSDGTVTADSVRLGSGSLRGGGIDRNSHELRGVVTGTTNRYTTRDLKVRVSSGREVTVHVPKNIVIRRDGRNISVHDLSSDDEVRIQGRYDGDDFRADRIEVTGNYSDRGYRADGR